MASTIHLLSDTSDLVELFAPQNLFLKPLARLNITVQLPQLKDPGQTISNWDIMEKIKRTISPNQFSVLKVSKTCLEFVRFEAEVESRESLQKIIKILDNATIKVIGFYETFKVKSAEAKSDFPSKHDWDSYFRDAKNVDECKAGERPDTIIFNKLPSKWFQDLRPNKGKDNRTKNEPSEFVLRRVFETFGEVRCVDIPQIDPSRASSSTIKMFNFGGEFTFDAYVQFVEYISFMKTMDALRNMKLVHVDDEGKAFAANIKVDFDRTKHLTDKNIRRRRLVREAFLRSEKILLENLQKAEEEEKRRTDEERVRLEYETQILTKEKLNRRREREEKRRLKHLEEKRKEEEKFIERKIKSEERRLIKAQRQLESIRLLSELFKLAKPEQLKAHVERELFELEDAQLKENEKRLRLEQEERDRRERLLRKREFMLRNNVMKKYQEIEDKREEFKREELRKKVRSSGTLRSVAAQPIKHLLPSYSVVDSSEDEQYYLAKKHSVSYFRN